MSISDTLPTITLDAPHSLDTQLDQMLSSSPFLNGRRVRIECSSDEVVLSGTVGSYFQKQMAQEAIRRAAGSARIQNQLEVEY